MSTSYPINAETNVYLNKPLWYRFDADIDMDSVYSGSIILYDVSTSNIIEGAYSYDQATFTLTFLPSKTLTANTSYTWTIAGADSPDAVPVKYADTTSLPTTVFIDFQTGGIDRVYDALPNDVTSEVYTDGVIEDGDSIEERRNDTFRVLAVSPEHKSAQIDVLSTSISITFSKDLDTNQDLSSLISLKYEPFMRESYVFKNNTFKSTVSSKPGVVPEASMWDFPAGTWAISGNTATWTKTDVADPFNANEYIVVTLNKGILAIDGEALNVHNERFYFITQIYPCLTSVNQIIATFGSIQGFLDEYAILRLILKYSWDICDLTTWKLNPLEPISAAVDFVEGKVVCEIIDHKLIGKEINAGKVLRLADLTVDVGYPRSGSGTIGLKTQADKWWNEGLIETLARFGGFDGKARIGFRNGERGQYTHETPTIFNVYRHQAAPDARRKRLTNYPIQIPR